MSLSRRSLLSLLAGTAGVGYLDVPWASGRMIDREIRFSFTMQNVTATTIENQRVWLYGPAVTATQQLEELDINAFYQATKDALGNTIILIGPIQLGAYESRIVTVRARLSMHEDPFEIGLGNRRLFLSAERFIEVDDSEIKSLAGALKRDDSLSSARAVYEWVHGNLTYAGYLVHELGAAYAIRKRTGDCTEFSDLSAALLRALQIPARILGGYVVDGDSVLQAKDYHNWCEAYVDNQWVLIDAQRGAFDDMNNRYVTFHIMSTFNENEMRGNERFRTDAGATIVMK